MQVGFIVYHQDVSATDYLGRAAAVGWENRDEHKSHPDIVYVNRYDWVGIIYSLIVFHFIDF